ncbi:acyl-CoA thioesterase-1 [Sinomonas atrocyanea]|jgi:acyl-CoA thioesterase-1|uniref:SGNH/GDSL hydrolase family protein n=1 Tax=Sinomonas atrocyanea TaxID=37927 RepID=UPI0027856916|nr:SGNH/GDSL hydrolase family protein [Sinomonas atrocyanea]MDQ0258508.1 acyl-CoA thioesterase-1 [Sinomonas atrocyanea]
MDRAPRRASRSAAALLVALAVLLTGCEASQVLPAPSDAPQLPSAAPQPPSPARYVGNPGPVLFGTAPLVLYPRTTTARRLTPARYLPLGSLWVDPLTQRIEPVLGDLSRTAVLIGDSQSAPRDSWVRGGLRGAGYSVYFAGAGGTGYSVGNRRTHAYVEALRRGDWRLPAGTPRLVVVEGGGNDASRGSGNAAIAAGAKSLVAELRRTYPGSRIVMVGTLAKAAADGGGRRTRVDTLLRRTADGLGVPFISCGDWISRYHLKNQLADGVHLKPAGRARLAPVLTAALRKLGVGIT